LFHEAAHNNYFRRNNKNYFDFILRSFTFATLFKRLRGGAVVVPKNQIRQLADSWFFEDARKSVNSPPGEL
jgi:hypothetical protein